MLVLRCGLAGWCGILMQAEALLSYSTIKMMHGPINLRFTKTVNLFFCFCKEWWTHLWLNEGYASFVEFLCVAYLFPEYDIWTQFVADSYIPALELDCLNNSHPIEVMYTVYTVCFICIFL